MKNCIVFDWDGTLHDTKKLYADSVRKAYSFLVDQGAAEAKDFSDDDLSGYLGMTAKAMWADFMPGLEESLRSRAEQMVSASMGELVYAGHAILYPGVKEVLDQLKEAGYELHILSNCKIPYMEAHRNVFGLDRWFTGFYPAQKYDFIPKEEIMKIIMAEHPGNYVVVGDRCLDLAAGKKNNLPAIGCSYGFGELSELAEADTLISDIRQLPEALVPYIL